MSRQVGHDHNLCDCSLGLGKVKTACGAERPRLQNQLSCGSAIGNSSEPQRIKSGKSLTKAAQCGGPACQGPQISSSSASHLRTPPLPAQPCFSCLASALACGLLCRVWTNVYKRLLQQFGWPLLHSRARHCGWARPHQLLFGRQKCGRSS